MSQTHNGKGHAAPESGTSIPIGAEEALAQVERLLTSSTFRTSKRCASFLRYVAQHALQGEHELLKERLLGVEIFGRTPGYDTNEDTIVRNTAGEVRKRLAQYYQETGHEEELRVELPVGTYVPVFAHPSQRVAAVSEPAPAAEPSRWRHWAKWSPAALAVVVVVVLTIWLWPKDAIDEFWGPVFRSPGDVLVCVGTPAAFNFRHSVQVEVERMVREPNWRSERGQQTLQMRDLLPVPGRYITMLDGVALSRIAVVLNDHSKTYHIRGGGTTSFTDLRDNATVLIGAFSNDWTLKVDDGMRFYFSRDSADESGAILDRQNPQSRSWTLARVWPEWNITEDYAIVSRVLARDTGRVLVTAAGITQYGTSAAGEFVTNPAYLAQALRQAPPGWKHQNMEVVISTRVVEDAPGPPRILATHFW